MYRFLIGLLLLCAPSTGFSQEAEKRLITWEDSLGLVKHVEMNVIDDVVGGCWKNKSSVEAEVRLLFEQSDIAVVRKPLAFNFLAAPQVELSGVGYRAGDLLCVGMARLTVYYYSLVPAFHLSGTSVNAKVELFEVSAVFSNSTSQGLDAQFSDFFRDNASNFASDVLSARRSEDVVAFFEEFPIFGKDPMTREEWDGLVNSMDD
ncbi:MAG: hypothetical protein AAGL23_02195 [Pseudomonadota bacterium]